MVTAQQERPFLTEREFRTRVPIGRTLLSEKMQCGEIASIKIGARRLIPASEVDRLRQIAEDSLRNNVETAR